MADETTCIAGRKPVRELLENDPGRVDAVFFRQGRDQALEPVIRLAKSLNLRHRFVDREELDRLFPGNHQGVVARTAAMAFIDPSELAALALTSPVPLILALDKVQDTGNVGAMARTLYALGGAGILTVKHEGAYLGAGAMRASAGALNRLPVAKATNLSQALDVLADQGFTLYCAGHAADSISVFEARLATPAVLVLGNEDKGVRPGVSKHCHASLHIPFRRDFDSLNVAQAAAIIMAMFSKA